MSKRRLTVPRKTQQGSGLRSNSRSVASFRLSGKCLVDLGFKTGDRFVVRDLPGRIELLSSRSAELESLER